MAHLVSLAVSFEVEGYIIAKNDQLDEPDRTHPHLTGLEQHLQKFQIFGSYEKNFMPLKKQKPRISPKPLQISIFYANFCLPLVDRFRGVISLKSLLFNCLEPLKSPYPLVGGEKKILESPEKPVGF